MIKRVRALPTPVAGLALGISSLGWSMENALPLHGWGQLIGAGIAVVFVLGLEIGRRRVGKECRSRWSPYH